MSEQMYCYVMVLRVCINFIKSQVASVCKSFFVASITFQMTRFIIFHNDADDDNMETPSVLFRRLLLGHPFTRPQIWKEVKTDVTPIYRGKIWAALLDVEGDVRGRCVCVYACPCAHS